MKLADFIDKCSNDVVNFMQNMDGLEYDADMSYADWFDKFRAWCEVGTHMELIHHGQRELEKQPDDEPVDILEGDYHE